MLLAAVVVIIGYFLGAFPSAYIIGRYWAKIDILKEGAGHISATAVYRKAGRNLFIVTLLADLSKALIALFLAQILTDSILVVSITGLVVAIGHCWSIFIKFNGGLGAVVIFGTVAYLAPLEFGMGFIMAVIIIFLTRKSTLSTYLLLITASTALFVEQKPIPLAVLPLALMAVQILRTLQTRKEKGEYTNQLFQDLKKVR